MSHELSSGKRKKICQEPAYRGMNELLKYYPLYVTKLPETARWLDGYKNCIFLYFYFSVYFKDFLCGKDSFHEIRFRSSIYSFIQNTFLQIRKCQWIWNFLHHDSTFFFCCSVSVFIYLYIFTSLYFLRRKTLIIRQQLQQHLTST